MQKQQTNVSWLTAGVFLFFHIVAIATVWLSFSWRMAILAAVVWFVSGSLGIGVCFHRLLTHRGYEVPKWLEYLLTICGLLAFQGGAIKWVSQHRLHHAKSDIPREDPHSPRDGILHAHIGWMVFKNTQTLEPERLKRLVNDLLRDRNHRLLEKFFWLPIALLFAILLFAVGWQAALWATIVPVVVGWNFTWAVNSITHTWGSRPCPTNDDSRNNAWLALPTFGESWHNYHHYDPVYARHGRKWYQIDVNWLIIRGLSLIGLVQKIKSPRPLPN